MFRIRTFVLILTGVLLTLGCSQTVSKPATQEAVDQVVFSVEDDTVRRPVSVPKAILTDLSKDDDIREVMKAEGLDAQTVPDTWFLASDLHLKSPDVRDIIVIASGPLLGANVTTFWIFRSDPTGFTVLLRGVGHTLEIKNSRTNGLKDIHLSAATATKVTTVEYKFSGARYEPSTGSTQ